MTQPDVTIRGAGIFGLAIAHACARRGARVRVVDPGGPGAGASGGIVGALAPHTPENWNEKKAFQFDSLIMAGSFWDEVEHRSGRPSGYGRLGRLQPVDGDRALALADERAQGAARLWQGLACWQVIAADDAGDWAPLSPSGRLIRDTLSARLHPAQACAALAAAVTAQGGSIVPDAEPATGRPEVWATGHAGLLALSAETGRPVGTGVKGQAALLRLDRRGAPQLFAGGLHVVPHSDGTVAIGSTSERDYDDPAATDGQLDDVLARARAAVPALGGAPVIGRWAGVRPRARSRAPMLGPHPTRAGVFIANGGFKIGFGMAPKVAEVMADLVLDGRDVIPAGFRVEDNL
ncbi:FAD-dependent oxidoreductase [Meridianimarinicoccus roseus]|uniref:FAD-dependent oxidoreductase n=1 Tax=Meridianimarinicoccus roseus TaxID=2072018 RepID=A0A2V2LHZ3_9RHOB|nr:FAD-binding oxidoreductase [Meridianimarinicoccus roseus]PWR02757.1 FAD-dependent oxidoreductase [Meridianimarinicoccus roseus]